MKVNGTNLAMIRGDSESITLSLKDGEAVIPFILGDTVYFTVKRSATVDEIALQKTITEFNEDGNYILSDRLIVQTVILIYLNQEDPLPGKTTLYRVQCGAFSKKENAEKLLVQLKEAGFTGFVTEAQV